MLKFQVTLIVCLEKEIHVLIGLFVSLLINTFS